MSALATTQAAMHDWLRHGDPAIAARVEGPLVAHRLRIHADAYRLRLIEVLANDYPVTAALLDEAMALARAEADRLPLWQLRITGLFFSLSSSPMRLSSSPSGMWRAFRRWPEANSPASRTSMTTASSRLMSAVA